MTTVALVGGDGAGKSSIASELAASSPHVVKVVYLGMNPDSGRFSLPTTRLSHLLKKRRAQKRSTTQSTKPISLHSIEQRKDSRGRVWATLRLMNRIAEATVKWLVAAWYQARGAVVVFDRHYLFDFTPSSSDRPRRLTSRIYLAFLEKVYPKPDLVVFLDASIDTLLARKQEVPASYLEGRRAAFLRRGAAIQNFVVVDADREFQAVYQDVAAQIEKHLNQRSNGAA